MGRPAAFMAPVDHDDQLVARHGAFGIGDGAARAAIDVGLHPFDEGPAVEPHILRPGLPGCGHACDQAQSRDQPSCHAISPLSNVRISYGQSPQYLVKPLFAVFLMRFADGI